jgi:hypothetical protein
MAGKGFVPLKRQRLRALLEPHSTPDHRAIGQQLSCLSDALSLLEKLLHLVRAGLCALEIPTNTTLPTFSIKANTAFYPRIRLADPRLKTRKFVEYRFFADSIARTIFPHCLK